VTEATRFTGGPIFTGRRYVESLLLEDGRVVAAGDREAVRRATPAGAEHRELGGALVLPGLIDAHLHVAELTRMREGLDLSRLDSVEAVVRALAEYAERHPKETVLARGWDPERGAERRWPTRRELDRAVPDRPAFVQHVSGHVGVANSAALARAGVDRRTADPPGGRFGREPDGELDGRVFEAALRPFVARPDDLHLPSAEAFQRTGAWALGLGLTSVGAMSVGPEEADTLAALSSAGRWPIRTRAYLHEARWTERGLLPATPGFAVVGVKAFTDGAFGPRTAWLEAPYADDPGNAGMSVASDEHLHALVVAVAARGLGIALHAIGDRALGQALRVLERAPRVGGRPPRIEHAALTPPAVWPALERVRPALVVQPGFVWSDRWLGDRLGIDRARWAYAFRTLRAAGHLLAGSSDAPYDPADPWRGLAAAVHRTGRDGASANAAPEGLRPEEALALYTVEAGRALGSPTLGHLEPGAEGDLLVVGAPTVERAIALGAAGVRETWVGGRRVGLGGNGKTV